MGIKPLLPALREKKRYVAFEVLLSKRNSFQEVSKALSSAFLFFLGELELAKAGIIMIANTFNVNAQKGVIRVNNKYVDHVKAALTFVKFVNQEPVIVRSLIVSGVLNKALKRVI
ncbi:ribonuclease P protein component 2 [Candidatus Woesearchaeota archaeon]|nr:ribonuclease P protein component 2 [Candidatus Woesearchaeota archaeon]